MGKSYICPYCGVLAGMESTEYSITLFHDRYVLNGGWEESGTAYVGENTHDNQNDSLIIVNCRSCGEIQLWINDKMVYPKNIQLPLPIADMPEDIKKIYLEAREVFEVSPRAGAALLRLALQKLCKELGGEGKNINDDIKKLVLNGLPVEIQQALDTIRIIGNNSVHPGEINIDESKELAAALFPLLNFIVDRMISQPKKVEEIYSMLPKSSLNAISNRNKNV